jgi:hypothetical protein
MNNLNINNLAPPIKENDAVTKKYADTATPWFNNSGYNSRAVAQVALNQPRNNTIIEPLKFSDYLRPVKIMYTMHFTHGPNFSYYNTDANYTIYLRFYNPPPPSALPYYSQVVNKNGNIGTYSNNENYGFYLFNTAAIPNPTYSLQSFRRIVHGEITFWPDLQMFNNSSNDNFNNTIRMTHECNLFGYQANFDYYKTWGQLNNTTSDAYTGNGNYIAFEFYTPDNSVYATNAGTNPGIRVEYYIHKT